MTDRRRDGRVRVPAATPVHATLRPGCPVQLVDVSPAGAMVQSPRPLRPGGRIQLVVVMGARRIAIAGVVVRCMVWALDPLDGVVYRGALKFDERHTWSWQASRPPAASPAPATPAEHPP